MLGALVDHRCRFLVVGGAAAELYGSTRQTNDVDVLVDRAPENLDCLAAALAELRARLRAENLPDEDALRLDPGWDRPRIEQTEVLTLRTDAGALDVLATLPDRDGRQQDYQALRARARRILVAPGLSVLAADLEDVVKSKEWADRPKDRAALPELRRLAAELSDGESGHD